MGSVVAVPRRMQRFGLQGAKEGGPPAAIEWRCGMPKEDHTKEEMQVPRLGSNLQAARVFK